MCERSKSCLSSLYALEWLVLLSQLLRGISWFEGQRLHLWSLPELNVQGRFQNGIPTDQATTRVYRGPSSCSLVTSEFTITIKAKDLTINKSGRLLFLSGSTERRSISIK